MAKTIRLLTALLAVQVALAVGLAFTGTSLSAAENHKPLLAFKPDQVDRVTIDGPNQAHVVLAKVDGHWQLPDVGAFPAVADRIERLLKQLGQLKPGEPVATTKGARERFKVAEKTFERRIVLGAGDTTLGTLYLGTSPAMRQVHARLDAQDDIYAVNLETYEVPVKADEWEDHAILQVPQRDIAGIDVDGLQLRRAVPAKAAAPASPAAKPVAATAWQAAQLAAGERVDAAAVDKLAAQLANLRIEGVLGKTAKPDYGLAQPALQLTVEHKDGKALQYQLGKMAAGGDYALKSSAREEYFELPEYAAQQLLDAAKRQALAPAATVASAKAVSSEKHPAHKKH